MNISADERAVMADVVVDVDKWVADAVAHGGEAWAREALTAKIARHRLAYTVARDQPGYKTRAARQAEIDAAHALELEEAAQAASQAVTVEALAAALEKKGVLTREEWLAEKPVRVAPSTIR